MEGAFGADFSRVRLHDGAAAGESANRIGAQAYTLGADIAFAPGRWSPATPDGRRLLAHELAHVVQQSGAPSVPQPAAARASPVAAPRLAGGPRRRWRSSDVDVCLVDVQALTNEALIAQTARVTTYLRPRRRGEDDYYAYANLGRRLDEERRARMRMGHLYLAASTTTFPTEVFRLQQRGEDLDVYRQDAGPLHGMPAQLDGWVLTENQFRQTLDDFGIPQVSLQDYLSAQTDPNAPLVHLLMPPRPAPPPLLPFVLPSGGGLDPFGVPRPGPLGLLPSLGVGPQPGQVILLGGQGALMQPWAAAAEPWPAGSPLTAALSGGRVYLPPYTWSAADTSAAGVNFNPANARSRVGAMTRYRGGRAEFSFGRGSLPQIVTQGDLNDIRPNFEVFDWRNRFTGDLVSVTSSVPTTAVPTGPRPSGPLATDPDVGWYDEKLAIAFGQEKPSKLLAATTRLNTAFGTALTTQDAATRAYLAINADHVERFRDRVRADLPVNPNDYARAIDAVLAERPLQVRTTTGIELTIGSWNALQAARPQLAPADYDARLAAAADLVAARVISNRIATIELAREVYFREYVTGIGVTTEEQFRAQVPPELEASIRAGGTPAAAFRAGLQGAAVQGVIGTGTDVWRMATDPYAHPYWAPEIVARGGLQAAGGFASQAAETAIIAPTAEALLGQTGAAASLLRGGSRLAVAPDPLSSSRPRSRSGSMALDELFTDAYYTRIDYAAAGTRSAFAGAGGRAIGTAGGALAAGGAGALMGSEVPLLGTAVGFVVGFGGYKLVDWWIGDDIEHGVRLALGEGGCPRPRPVVVPELDTPRFCFPAGVRVRMAGGGDRPVERLRPGDAVLSVDATTRTLVPQVVEDTVAHPATVVLTLLLADGTLLRTTSGHPVFDGAGWAQAGTLRPGDRVLCLDEAAGLRTDPLRTVGVVAVTTQAPEPVYDLTVSGTHTFLVEGVVVHNKAF